MSDEQTVLITKAMSDGNYVPAPSAVRLVEALMGGEEAVYIDVCHTPQDYGMHGRAVVLTETRVILASWSIPNELDRGRNPTTWGSTWARRSLVSAAIGTGGELNTYNDWSRANEGEWPEGGELKLEYKGGGTSLELPLRQDRETRDRFLKIVPELLADIGR